MTVSAKVNQYVRHFLFIKNLIDGNHNDSQSVDPPLKALTCRARKALTVHIGEKAGTEIADVIQQMASGIEELRRTKVNITRIVPGDEPN